MTTREQLACCCRVELQPVHTNRDAARFNSYHAFQGSHRKLYSLVCQMTQMSINYISTAHGTVSERDKDLAAMHDHQFVTQHCVNIHKAASNEPMSTLALCHTQGKGNECILPSFRKKRKICGVCDSVHGMGHDNYYFYFKFVLFHYIFTYP